MLGLGPSMPGLLPGTPGKTGLVAVFCASPAVSSRVPSGYMAENPQSSLSVLASGAVGLGMGSVSKSKDMLPLPFSPPGYACCCATRYEPFDESEWHDTQGPNGETPVAV